MNEVQPQARVFISCGQNPATDEVRIANDIRSLLTRLGFEAYVANFEHTPMEIVQAVFDALEASEYFLLIDFKREQLVGADVFRGSLFTQQELGIAAFLKIDQLRFCEAGVELKGISERLQGRPIEFNDRSQLASMVEREIERKDWKTGWKNALWIAQSPVSDRAVRRNHGGTADFHYIVVENLHNRKVALDCRVVVEFDDVAAPPQPLRDHVEQKWAGVPFNQSVAIRSNGGKRRACACFVERDQNGQSSGVYFHQFGIDTDSAEEAQPCPPGEYILRFTVLSSNFPATQRKFKLIIEHENDVSAFEPIPGI